jgi:hypothetical protein
MGKLRPGADIIYESPDGGETVYARYSGEAERWMVGQSANAKSRIDGLREDKLWGEIRRAAKTNPALQETLERAIIIYELSKKNG